MVILNWRCVISCFECWMFVGCIVLCDVGSGIEFGVVGMGGIVDVKVV